MLIWIATVEALIGLAYTALGSLTVYEMVRERATLGRSPFGLAFAAMAFPCGPHHLLRAFEAATSGHVMHAPSLALAALIGLPAGVVFVGLRLEMLRGGPGDREIRGLPNLVVGTAVAVGIAGGVLLTHAFGQGFRVTGANAVFVGANAVLSVSYVAVGCYILTTQLRRHGATRSWSLSGVALGLVFPTCALGHLAHVMTSHDAGRLSTFGPGWFDALGTPASVWFLVVVRRLCRGGLAAWNRRPLVGRGPAPLRDAPRDVARSD